MRSPRCIQCGFAHEPGDDSRCANARDLGLKLNARLNVRAVPRACEPNKHITMTVSAEDFLRNTEPLEKWSGEWTNGDGMRCLTRVCLRCGAHLTREIGSAVAAKMIKEAHGG